MSKLEKVILDQHARVRAAGENPIEALTQSQGEILEVATPELTLSLILDDKTSVFGKGLSSNAIIRAQNDTKSIQNRSISAIVSGHGLAVLDMLIPAQGYTGGIIFDHNEAIVFGHSATLNTIKYDDPIQEAMGQTFYPPMMWVKALRAEAYKNRQDSMQQLSIAEYLATLGLSLGSKLTDSGDIVGATGFMPGNRLQGEWGDESIEEHVRSEPVEAFKLSGFCDQAVLDPDILLDPLWFATSILLSSGSLN